MTRGKAGFGGTLVAAIVAVAIVAPSAGAALTARQRSGRSQMRWYRWHQSTRTLKGRRQEFGSTVVLGFESMQDLEPLRAAYGFGGVRAIPALHAAVVNVDDAQLQALLANAPSDPRLRYVSRMGPKRRAMSTPNDPLLHMIDGRTNLPYEWQFDAAHVARALDISPGDPGIVVGVIDTGVADIADLAGKLDSLWSVRGTEISRSPTEGNDEYGHGTAVASLIAANVDDGFGIAGFGGSAHVIGAQADIQGYFFDTQAAIALTKLVSLGARIVNMSFGGRTPSEPILVDAIHLAAANGVLLIASAGNDYGYVGWPAADLQPSGGGRSYGLAVGATSLDGRRADFSDWGLHLSVVAPGDYSGRCSGVLVALPPASLFDDSCYSTWSGDGGAWYGYLAGTSFAAPEVAGVAALIWAARPELENYQVADIIKQSAHRSASDWTPTMGCGLLDAGAALELAIFRPAAGWAAARNESGAVCSASGNAAPTWPTEANQTISFDPLPNRTFGNPDFRVRVAASSGLPVTLIATGDCTIRVATVHLTRPGWCTITASQEGDAKYNLAPSVSRSFWIAEPTPLAVHAFAASGSWGGRVRLSFQTDASDKEVAPSIIVRRDTTIVAQFRGGFFTREAGHRYTLTWDAPRARRNGAFRFCVTLSDHSGNTSAPDCRPIHLR